MNPKILSIIGFLALMLLVQIGFGLMYLDRIENHYQNLELCEYDENSG